MTKNCVVIFVRSPREGSSNSKLAKSAGKTVASKLYAAFLEDTVLRLRKLRNADLFLALPHLSSSAEAASNGKRLLPAKQVFVQRGNCVGRRISNAICHLLELGYAKVALVGSCSLCVQPSDIENTFKQLSRYDVAVGPRTGGDPYLIATSAPHPQFFEQIPWGMLVRLSQILTPAKSEQLSVSVLPEHQCVDSVETLHALCKQWESGHSAIRRRCFPNTRRVLEEVCPTLGKRRAAR